MEAKLPTEWPTVWQPIKYPIADGAYVNAIKLVRSEFIIAEARIIQQCIICGTTFVKTCSLDDYHSVWINFHYTSLMGKLNEIIISTS